MTTKLKTKNKRLLKLNKKFVPVSAKNSDELFRNGIFIFNISKMIEFIKSNPELFKVHVLLLKDYRTEFSVINEEHFDSLNNTEPVILGEIAPGKYNIIDGNHRTEKAYRAEKDRINAYKIQPELHIQFLTTLKGYHAYIDYWNDKINTYPNRI